MDDPGTFGKYDFKLLFFVKVWDLFNSGKTNKKLAKFVFSPRTGTRSGEGWGWVVGMVGWLSFRLVKCCKSPRRVSLVGVFLWGHAGWAQQTSACWSEQTLKPSKSGAMKKDPCMEKRHLLFIIWIQPLITTLIRNFVLYQPGFHGCFFFHWQKKVRVDWRSSVRICLWHVFRVSHSTRDSNLNVNWVEGPTISEAACRDDSYPLSFFRAYPLRITHYQYIINQCCVNGIYGLVSFSFTCLLQRYLRFLSGNECGVKQIVSVCCIGTFLPYSWK